MSPEAVIKMPDNGLWSITGVPGFHTPKSNRNHMALSRNQYESLCTDLAFVINI